MPEAPPITAWYLSGRANLNQESGPLGPFYRNKWDVQTFMSYAGLMEQLKVESKKALNTRKPDIIFLGEKFSDTAGWGGTVKLLSRYDIKPPYLPFSGDPSRDGEVRGREKEWGIKVISEIYLTPELASRLGDNSSTILDLERIIRQARSSHIEAESSSAEVC